MDAEVAKKICLVGDFGVGKTSTVQRFVHQAFSEKYQTTVGVSIETRVQQLGNGRSVKLIIWDIAGKDTIDAISNRYLKGSDGILLVVDGTRGETAEAANSLKQQIAESLGPVPLVCLFNKSDLREQWALSADQETELRNGVLASFRTSAKTGENIESAFLTLATESTCPQ